MRIKRFATAVGLTAVGALVVSGCAPGGDSGDSGLVEGSSITAAWNQAFYSMNGNTSSTKKSQNSSAWSDTSRRLPAPGAPHGLSARVGR